MTEKLSPKMAALALRAKAGELEHRVSVESESLDVPMTTLGLNMAFIGLMADIALVAQLLADHIERTEKSWRARSDFDVLPREPKLEVACEVTWGARKGCSGWGDDAGPHGCGKTPGHDGPHVCPCGARVRK